MHLTSLESLDGKIRMYHVESNGSPAYQFDAMLHEYVCMTVAWCSFK